MALRAVLDHPKFTDLKARLGRPRFAVLGCLEAIWHFTGRFTPQGNIGKYSDQAIEAWAEWDGEPGALIAALCESRFIDAHETFRLVVHDWAQHADKATKNALNRSRIKFCVGSGIRTRKKYVRTEKHQRTDMYGLPEPEPVPEPEPEKEAKACAAASAAPAIDRHGSPIRLPMINGEEWSVMAADCAAWAQAYPGIEVDVQLLRAREWLLAHPRNRKTPRGMRSFITSWLGRAQDRAQVTGSGNGGYGNRGQARTDGNIAAARRAAAVIAGCDVDRAGGSAPGSGEPGDAHAVRGMPF